MSLLIGQNYQNAGKARENCNWKEGFESGNLNISTVDSDMGTGYGDGDVEDAYHAIFGEEKKCSKGQKSSNTSTEPSPTSIGSSNVENVLDAAAAALSGSKRDRKGELLEGKKEEDGSPVLSKTVKNEISSLSVGKIVTITSGEYCDWEGEVLCIETSQSYPKSANKSKQSEAFYVVALQYSDGSPLDCCVLVPHSMITSKRSRTDNEEKFDDISDDTEMGCSASGSILNDDANKGASEGHRSTALQTLDFTPKSSKLSFQISPIRPGRNDKSIDKVNHEMGDIICRDKFFSEECIEIVEAFTADLVQSQINSEIVLSVLNEIKASIDNESKEQIKNEIHKNNINNCVKKDENENKNDSMTEKDIKSGTSNLNIHKSVKIDLDVVEKCESIQNKHLESHEGNEIFSRNSMVHAEEKAEHEKLKVENEGKVSKIVSKSTQSEADFKNETDTEDSAIDATVNVEGRVIVSGTAITGEEKASRGDDVSCTSNSGSAAPLAITVFDASEENGLVSDSVFSSMSTGAENITKNNNDNNDSSNNNTNSNSNNNSVDGSESDVHSQPLTSAQVRYQQYAALRAFDMSTVGRRVRITATGNKHRYAHCMRRVLSGLDQCQLL